MTGDLRDPFALDDRDDRALRTEAAYLRLRALQPSAEQVEALGDLIAVGASASLLWDTARAVAVGDLS